MARTFAHRLSKESLEVILETYENFVCMLTDEQLQKRWNNCLVTIQALSTCETNQSASCQKYIREEQLIKDVIEEVCNRRKIKLSTPTTSEAN